MKSGFSWVLRKIRVHNRHTCASSAMTICKVSSRKKAKVTRQLCNVPLWGWNGEVKKRTERNVYQGSVMHIAILRSIFELQTKIRGVIIPLHRLLQILSYWRICCELFKILLLSLLFEKTNNVLKCPQRWHILHWRLTDNNIKVGSLDPYIHCSLPCVGNLAFITGTSLAGIDVRC